MTRMLRISTKDKTDKHRNVQLADLPIVLAPQHSEDSTNSKHSEVAKK